ncbi:hypothetical protein ES703_03771 [subsurface metagenome]
MPLGTDPIEESHRLNYMRIVGAVDFSLDARDVLYVLCRDCNDSGFYEGNCWQCHLFPRRRPTVQEANPPDHLETVKEALAELERLRIITYRQYECQSVGGELRDGIQIMDWESDQDQAFLFTGMKGSSPEMRLQSPQIKLLRQVCELAEKLGVSKAELCRQWGVANRQIYYYLKGEKLPSRRTFGKMTVTYHRLQLSDTSSNMRATDQNSSTPEAS